MVLLEKTMPLTCQKKPATVQVDLDGYWAYCHCLGLKSRVDDDPFYDKGFPRMLSLFEHFDLKATFFVVARDLEIPWKRRLVEKALISGHEIACHGYSHRYFTELSIDEKKAEIEKSTFLLSQIAKGKIIGFRAPGCAIDEETLSILEEFGYLYDSSVWPMCLSPVLKFLQKRIFKKEFSGYNRDFSFILSPSQPYYPSHRNIYLPGKRSILEIPVTTFPFLRTPFHLSYLFLAGKQYFKFGIWLSKIRPKYLNFVFHLVDTTDSQKHRKRLLVDSGISLHAKIKMAEYVLRKIKENYSIQPTREFYYKYQKD